MSDSVGRRTILKCAAVATVAIAVGPETLARQSQPTKAPLFRISLAQWSFHNALNAKQLDPLDFAATTRALGLEGCEYVNSFYKDKARDKAYLAEMRKRCDDNGVPSLLIMCDGEGNLGDPDDGKRKQAVENHHKWADAAKALGCHSIRVNAASSGPRDEQERLAADGLRRLTEYCATLDLNCIVENHGGLSSHGDWLSAVMKRVSHARCGTLPDFGNFYEYDRYKGVEELMPFAKAVSAKSYDFDEKGDESKIDYPRMLKLVIAAGYRQYIGIEYEGARLPEREGVLATKRLLERIRSQIAPG